LTGTGYLEYARILQLAARTMECDVALALDLLLSEKQSPTLDLVKALVTVDAPQVPRMAALQPDLKDFDRRFLRAMALKEVA
jgi:hypothetical protein